MKTVFDLTHVLTQGIIEREVIDEKGGDFLTVRMIGGFNNKKYLHKGEWTADLESANKIADSIKLKKIINLKKQIEKLDMGKIKVFFLNAE